MIEKIKQEIYHTYNLYLFSYKNHMLIILIIVQNNTDNVYNYKLR